MEKENKIQRVLGLYAKLINGSVKRGDKHIKKGC